MCDDPGEKAVAVLELHRSFHTATYPPRTRAVVGSARATPRRDESTEHSTATRMHPLDALLTERDWVLADGAMGTNLFALGLTGGASGERWNLDEPDRVASVHQAMVEAGADIILTNTFGANRYRLALHGLADRAIEINESGGAIARAVADRTDRTVVVAGSMGPTGDVLAPLGERTLCEAVDAFAEQAEGLRRGGVDVAWIETMYAENELAAAVRAVTDVGLTCLATMTFDTAGRTMMGIRPQDMPGLAPCRTHALRGIGANCGVGPAQLLDSILGLRATADPEMVIVAKSNCGLPAMDDDLQVRYDGTPEIMADYACMARDAGARVIGGCCGTTASHLAAMREALERRPRAEAPDHAAIEAHLGPLKVTLETEEAIARVKEVGTASERRLRRRRRRT